MTATIAAIAQDQSLAAIRNFVRTSVSCITHARGLCNDASYESHVFLGIPVMHMVPVSTEAVTISEWIEKGAFDALNRNYLKEMALCVHNGDCTEQLESYCFGFAYTSDGQRASLTLNSTQQVQGTTIATAGGPCGRGARQPRPRKTRCSKEEVRQALTSILTRLLEVVSSLPPLLSERVVTMRLTYYDDVTPDAYQPPCFAPASERMVGFYHEEQKTKVSIGTMDTSHQLFSVAIRHPVLAHVRNGMLQQRRRDAKGENQESRCRKGQPRTLPTTTTGPLSTPDSSWTEEEEGHSTFSTSGQWTPKDTATTGEAARPRPTAGPPVLGTQERITQKRDVARQAQKGSGQTKQQQQQQDTTRRDGALSSDDVRSFGMLHEVVGKSAPLRSTEVAYLLLVGFVFARCAPSLGGRARLTSSELRDHLRESCAVDISLDAAASAMQKLVADGYLVTTTHQEETDGTRRQKTARTACVRHAAGDVLGMDETCDTEAGAAALERVEWVMPLDPPLSILTALLEQRQVMDLLSPADHIALTKLSATVKMHERRVHTSLAVAGPRRRGDKRGRSSPIRRAESRESRQDAAAANC